MGDRSEGERIVSSKQGTLHVMVGNILFVGAHALHFVIVALGALAVFASWRLGFYLPRRHEGHFFFDPQDCSSAGQKGRAFPLSAKAGTFEPLLKHYIGVAQLIFTVAAASIAVVGVSPNVSPVVVIAKIILAWSIAYGVLFCALLLWRYDEYTQDLNSLRPAWYATIFASGFSSLTCFMMGYLVWGLGL